jgi:hypothetical protein
MNWRDPAQYPDPADTSLHRWAWEFLRRNPVFEAQANAAITSQRALRAAGKLPEFWSKQPLGAVLKSWGVKFPILAQWRGPEFDAPVRFDVAPRDLPCARIGGQMTVLAPLRDDRRPLEFDLSAPLDPQLARARLALIADQKRKFPKFRRSRNQTEKFVLYLRVLDALEMKATTAELLELSPGDDERALRRWTKRAIALRDGGYRELLAQ